MIKKLIIGTMLLIAGTVTSKTTQQKIAAARNKTLINDTPAPAKVETLNAGMDNPNYAKVRAGYDGYYGSARTKAGLRKSRS